MEEAGTGEPARGSIAQVGFQPSLVILSSACPFHCCCYSQERKGN